MSAQRKAGDIAIGLQLGEPTGLSLLFYRTQGPSVDLLTAWDLDDFFYLNAHALYYKRFPGYEYFNFIYGPGVFIGLIDKKDLEDAIDLGISGTLGISVIYQKFEIYFRVTPRVALLDTRKVDIGGGLGLRYYL